MNKVQDIRKSISQYFLATIFGNIFGLLRNIFLPFIYTPAQLGIWNLMNVLLSYSANMHLGVLHGMNKLIPVYKAKNENRNENLLVSSIFWFNIILAIITLIGFAISAFYFEVSFKIPLLIIGLASFCQQLFAYYFSLLRSNEKFKIVSIGTAMLSLVTLFFIFILTSVSKYKIEAGLFSIVIANILVVIYFHNSQKIIINEFDSNVIKKALITGLPLIIIGILDTLLITVDRWLIASNYSKNLLGNYALGVMTSSLISVIPGVISSVIYPKLIQKHTENNDLKQFAKLVIQPIKTIWILMFLLTGFSLIIIPFLIINYLPKYSDSISLVELFIIGAYFFSSSFTVGSVIIAINKQKTIIYLQILVIVFILTTDLIIIKNNLSIELVALGTIIGYFIYGFGYNIIAFYHLKINSNNFLKLLFQLILPFVSLISLYFYMSKFAFFNLSNYNIYIILFFRLAMLTITMSILIYISFFDKTYKKYFLEEFKKIF